MEFLDSLDPEIAQGFAEFQKQSPDLGGAFIERLYGDLYQRERLSLRERFLVVISSLIVSGQMQAQLATQVRLTLKSGMTREELMEVALQVSVFSGFGCAMNAMSVIDAVADQLEIES